MSADAYRSGVVQEDDRVAGRASFETSDGSLRECDLTQVECFRLEIGGQISQIAIVERCACEPDAREGSAGVFPDINAVLSREENF